MRKLYNEFFYVPKHGKIREKVMLTRVAITIVIMVICLAAMSFSAYAYFSYNVSSAQNMIASANFDLQVSVTPRGMTEPLSITKTKDKTSSVSLTAGEYTVVLTRQGTAANGFCKISSEAFKEEYITHQLGEQDFVFKLQLTGEANIEFSPCWGTSTHYVAYKENGTNTEQFVIDGEVIVLSGTSQTQTGYSESEQSEPTAPAIDTEEAEVPETTPVENATVAEDTIVSQTETAATETTLSQPETETTTPESEEDLNSVVTE